MVEQNGELFAVEKDQASLVGTVGWMMYMYMMCCFKLVLEFGHQKCEKNLALYFCNVVSGPSEGSTAQGSFDVLLIWHIEWHWDM